MADLKVCATKLAEQALQLHMLDKLPFLVLFYPVFLFSLSFHETAHAWMANRFGDPTARLMGRITINPLPHMDIIGTALLPIVAILTGAPLIGWGKPVPVNPYNLKDPRKDELWIAGLGHNPTAVFFRRGGSRRNYLEKFGRSVRMTFTLRVKKAQKKKLLSSQSGRV